MNYRIVNKQILFFECALLAILTFYLQVKLRGVGYFFVFQTRDLDRAAQILAGHPIFFGPETTGGGHLPGPFYYFLLALPLALGLGWPGAFDLMLLLNALALAGLWYFLRRNFGLLAAVFTSLAYLISGKLLAALLSFYNSSFIFVFVVLALIALCLTYAGRLHRERYFVIFGLAVGLGAQLHFSVAFLLLTPLLLQWQSRRLNLLTLPTKSLAMGFGAFIFTTLPFLLWTAARALHLNLGQRGLSSIGQASHSPFGVFRYAGIFSLDGLFQRLGCAETYRGLFANLRAVLPSGIVGLAAFGIVACWCLRKRSDESEFRRNSLKVLLLSLAIATIPMSPVLFSLVLTRYMIVFTVTLLLFLGVLLSDLSRGPRAGKFAAFAGLALVAVSVAKHRYDREVFANGADVALVSLFTVLVIWNERPRLGLLPLAAFLLLPLFVVGSLRHTRVRREGAVGGAMTIAEFEAMSRRVVERTGWDYATARERIFYLNTRLELTPRWIYEGMPKTEGVAQTREDIDGFFVAAAGRKELRDPKFVLKDWLVEQNLEPTLVRGVDSDAVVLGKAELLGRRVLLVPYWVRDPEHYPSHFQNKGSAYEEAETSQIDEIERNSMAAPPNRILVATFADCQGAKAFCRVSIVVEGRDLRNPKEEVRIRVLGEPIAMPSEWIIPDATEALIEPFIVFTCGDIQAREVIAEIIGFPSDQSIQTLNHLFLAPFERRLRSRCKTSIEKIELGYKSAILTVRGEGSELPSRSRQFLMRPKEN